MSDSDIDKMVNDAKKHESEDKLKREKIDLVNQAELVIYETEKNVSENSDKLEESEKSELIGKIDLLKKAKNSGNLDDIKTSMNDLNTFYSTLASKMTSSTNEAKTSDTKKEEQADTKKSKEGEVEDADFEVVE